MLTKDKIKEEFEKTVKACYHEEVRDGKPMVERDEVFAHLSAQYEKLIEEVMPESATQRNIEPIGGMCEEFAEGYNEALAHIRTSLQERGIIIK